MVKLISTKIIITQKSRQPNGHIYHRIAMPPDCSEFYLRKIYSDGSMVFTPLAFQQVPE